MKVLAKIMIVIGLIPSGIFAYCFIFNGMGAFVDVLNQDFPIGWWIIGGGLLLALIGAITEKICESIEERRYYSSSYSRSYSNNKDADTNYEDSYNDSLDTNYDSNYNNNSYDDYDRDYNDYDSNDDKEDERFINNFPNTYDKETGYSQSDYINDGYWTDSFGNKYEQKTDCWGDIIYEEVDDEEGDDD